MKNQTNNPRISTGNTVLSHGCVEYVHDGYTYSLPTPMLNDGVTFDDVEIVFQLHDRESSVGTNNECHEFVAMNTKGDYEMVMHLHDVSVPEDTELQHPLTAYVYRKNQRLPFWCLDLQPEDNAYDQLVNHLVFTPGDYFVVVNGATASRNCYTDTEEMAGMPTFHFTILEHGHNLAHPLFVHEQLEDLPLLELTAVQGQIKECDVYYAICYSNVYRRIYKHRCPMDEGKLHLTLMDIYWPVDDIYTCVLFHNNEPITAYRYTLLGKQVLHLTATPLSPGAPVYALATIIEEHPLNFNFTFEPGFKDVKDYLLNVITGHDEKTSLLVACEKQPAEGFVDFVMDQLYCTGHYQTVDATSLVNAWRENGASCLKEMLTMDGIYLQHISVLLHPTHQELLTALDRYMGEGEHCFYLFENTETVTALLKRLECADKIFSPHHRLLVPEYEAAEIVYMVSSCLSDSGYRLHPASLVQLTNLIYKHEELFDQLTRDDLFIWVKQSILAYIQTHETADDDEDKEYYGGIQEVKVDFDKVALPEEPVDSMEQCMAELNAMVGLETLKTRLKSLFNRTKFDNMRVQQGLPALNENRQHMIFTGNPGTGKTTVAKMIGKVFKQLGVLSEGKVITVERADMVGKYIGHTEETMKDLIERAKGNVLFIDEAYSLCDNTRGDRTDYGNRVIESLLSVLADNDSDMIVIMAGYEKQMKQMLEMNPGMRGRFIHTFNFMDYNADELLQICMNKLHSKQFSADDAVRAVMKGCIERTLATKDEYFHNARWAEQFMMQGIVTAMADRLCQEDRYLTPMDLSNVTAADVLAGYELTLPEKKPERRRAGFH